MVPGDRKTIVVPAVIPYPYFEFDSDWLAWIRRCQGEEVVLIEPGKWHYDEQDWPGWQVVSLEGSNWVPESWLIADKIYPGFCVACGGFRRHKLGCPV